MKVALITGVTGQDGAYLSRVFIEKRLFCSWPEKKNLHVQYRSY